MLHTEHVTKRDYLDNLAQAMVDPAWDDDVEDMRDVRQTFEPQAVNIDTREY